MGEVQVVIGQRFQLRDIADRRPVFGGHFRIAALHGLQKDIDQVSLLRGKVQDGRVRLYIVLLNEIRLRGLRPDKAVNARLRAAQQQRDQQRQGRERENVASEPGGQCRAGAAGEGGPSLGEQAVQPDLQRGQAHGKQADQQNRAAHKVVVHARGGGFQLEQELIEAHLVIVELQPERQEQEHIGEKQKQRGAFFFSGFKSLLHTLQVPIM